MRLVALFTAIAAVPTVLVAIFASLLFQSGLEFWFSDRARTMLENSVQVARVTYQREVDDVAARHWRASGNVANTFSRSLTTTLVLRTLSAGFRSSIDASAKRLFSPTRPTSMSGRSCSSTPYKRDLDKVITPEKMEQLKTQEIVPINSSDRIGDLPESISGPTPIFTCRAYSILNCGMSSIKRTTCFTTIGVARALTHQPAQFNAALLLGALVIVALAILTALRLADRMVRPVGELVDAAGRIEAGDFSARVPVSKSEDEVQMLALAFNRMTGRLEEQTGALRAVNTQLDTRRAFIEAVLGSVTAGIVALDAQNCILLINRSAEALLHKSQEQLEGKELSSLSAELSEFVLDDRAMPM